MTAIPAGGRVALFGGTGFLGRRIAERLCARGHEVRVATRHPNCAALPPGREGGGRVRPIRADVRDEASVAQALAGCAAAVNAVGLYAERGRATFEAVHEQGAANVARQAGEAGLSTLVHVSGIGADPRSRSRYVRARAAGETAVRELFPSATILRPSAMFGVDDALVNALERATRYAPVFPLPGRGRTRLQPVHVEDVAEAAVRCLGAAGARGRTCELGGPELYTYRDLVGLVLRRTGRRRLLLPVPFALWDALAAAASLLPQPPVTEAQVTLMKGDNVAAADAFSFEALEMTPTALSGVLPDYPFPAGGVLHRFLSGAGSRQP